jgi:large exoprotein involved in heme utilization and adhesion
VNQSGVNFYKGAQVNAAGVMVSAANITNQNFMAGVMKFDQPSSNPNAKIDNQGTITIQQAGLAALVAPQVANSGTISAKLGHVVLAGAKTATLDLFGDGLLSLDVTNQVTQAPVGPDGKAATALVTNTGAILADGGTVQLTARAADGIVQNLVQAGGTIRAATIGDKTGVVALNGVGGSIVVEGQLSTPGLAAGTKGGAIEVATTGNVTLAPTAKIRASGKAGGGVIAIGTTLDRARGGPGVTPTLTAANTVIQPGAKISANATRRWRFRRGLGPCACTDRRYGRCMVSPGHHGHNSARSAGRDHQHHPAAWIPGNDPGHSECAVRSGHPAPDPRAGRGRGAIRRWWRPDDQLLDNSGIDHGSQG